MRKYYRLLLAAVCISNGINAQVLIKNVQVLDVEKKKVLPAYNVLTNGDKITYVGKKIPDALPPGTTTIDGTGKYLIPGLTDAHVHFFQTGSLFTRPDAIDLHKYKPYKDEIRFAHEHMEDFLRRYTSMGITSVVDVGATYNFLLQRDSFANKKYAPLISMTGPLLTTYVPEPFKDLGDDGPFIFINSEESARKGVQDQIAHKADFIKIWYITLGKDVDAAARHSLPFVKSAIEEAHANHLRVAVHATDRISAQLAVEAGADFLVHNVDNEVVSDEFVALLKKKNAVLCPTYVVADGYAETFSADYTFSTDELNYSNPFTVASILDFPQPDTTQGKAYIKASTTESRKKFRASADSFMMINLEKLYKGGVTIATGTDAGNIGTQHAGSYFNELRAMQKAGFTVWDLLVACTINGAKAVGMQDKWGSIAKDKQANMVLVNADPLLKPDNWFDIAAIINKGIILDPDSIVINTPEMLVQQQLNAYNAHNLDAFLTPYADSVEVYDFPDKLMSKGIDKMRINYQFIKATPGLHCKLLNRIVEGNTVIDHEEIYVKGRKPFRGVAIYTIEKGRITKVYFP